jgi:hypothetical protein
VNEEEALEDPLSLLSALSLRGAILCMLHGGSHKDSDVYESEEYQRRQDDVYSLVKNRVGRRRIMKHIS